MYQLKRHHAAATKITTAVTAAAMALLFSFPAAAEPQNQGEREIPVVSFRELAVGTDQQRAGQDGRPYNRIFSDLFYIDYPAAWYFGANDYCPIVFYYEEPGTAASNEFQDFFDQNLNGDPAQVAAYVESGGISGYLQQVLGTPITSEYQLAAEEKEDIVLIYSLKKNGRTEASVIIWTFGKLSIRAENVSASYDASKERGSIMLFPERDETDFTSMDAIGAYVQAGNLNFYLDPFIGGAPSWTVTTCKTDFHEFYYCVGETNSHRIAVYIPVTPAGGKNWIVAFETDKGSLAAENAFDMRETFIKTFQALK